MNIYLLVAMNVTIMCSAVSFSTGISNLKAINLFIPQALIFLIICFNWRIITCNIVMVFAIHQHESAYTCVPPILTSPHLPPHAIPPGCLRALALGALFHASNLHWSFILHMAIYVSQCYSLKSSPPCLLPLSSKVCFLHLCLPCYLACRIIGTVFLNPTYMC